MNLFVLILLGWIFFNLCIVYLFYIVIWVVLLGKSRGSVMVFLVSLKNKIKFFVLIICMLGYFRGKGLRIYLD